jgi:hypothetical protein
VLSIWTPGADPRSPYSWTREVVINRALESYHGNLSKLRNEKYSTKSASQFQRIRTFTWSAPAILQSPPSQRLQVDADGWGEHFLAVGNDSNEIIISWVPSRDSLLRSKGGANLTAEPMAHFSVPAKNGTKLPDLSWAFEDYMRNHDVATHIAWSPWIRWQVDNSLLAIIAYTTRTRLGFRQVNISVTEDGRPTVQVGEHAAESLLPAPGAINGPLRWNPAISKKNRMQLLTSNGTLVICYDVSAIGNIDIKQSSYIRKEWDPISGTFFCPMCIAGFKRGESN